MKFLFFTDTHIRGTNPRNRKDNFYETLKIKFEEVISLCNEHEVDYVIHGGDWFDRPDVSPGIVKDFALILRRFERPIYTIAGNHDIFGHNPDTVGRTMLGVLEGAGIIKLMSYTDEYILEKQGIRVQLTGKPYRYDLDGENFRDYYITRKNPNVDYAVNVVHGMLLNNPFLEGIQYTLIEDIKDTEADVTFAGHYHTGFGIRNINGRYFSNPGSLCRISNALAELKRKPKVVLLELEKEIAIREIELKCAMDGEDVLDRARLEASQNRDMKFQQFYKEIGSAGEYKKINIDSIIDDIAANENLGKDVKQEAIRRIALAKDSLSVDEEQRSG